MNRKITFYLIILALGGATAAFAQVRQPHGLYFMETIPQITQMNPALQPRTNVYVMLPGGNIDFISDLAAKDLLQPQGGKYVLPIERQYDYDLLRKSIGKKSTMINLGVDADILGFGFRTEKGKGYFSIGLSVHVTSNIAMPSDFFKILENGFPDQTTFDFSPLRAQAVAYKQIRIGYSRKITDRLTVGINVKPLFGAAAVTSKFDEFELYTGVDRWELNAKGNLYASGPINVTTGKDGKLAAGLNSIAINDLETEDNIRYAESTNNPGIAFDLGAEYRIDDRLTVSASLNNLGFISWNQELNSMSFNGQYTFNGIHYDTSQDESMSDLIEALGDSIGESIDYALHHNKFKTPLPPVLHAAATYRLTPTLSAGLLSRTVFWKKGVRQSFHGSFNIQPYKAFAFNLGTTWQIKGGLGMEIGLTGFLGPLQIYVLADGIPVRYSKYTFASSNDDGRKQDPLKIPIPDHLKTITLRVGFNLVFGKHGYINKPMLDDRKSSW